MRSTPHHHWHAWPIAATFLAAATLLGCSTSQSDGSIPIDDASAASEARGVLESPHDTNPPLDAEAPTDAGSTDDSASSVCFDEPMLASPDALTFVIHVSKRDVEAAAAVMHLEEIRRFLRPRDIFMIERHSTHVQRIRQMFPCNRVHFIAYPAEMDRALRTGHDITGIVVDWEGSEVDSHPLSWSIDRLSEYSRSIHENGKQAGFCPAWAGRIVDDGNITRASNMDYELAQIQGACVRGAGNFRQAVRSRLHEFDARGISRRRLGFEISMNSFSTARNHVSAARAAACTREGVAEGALAIYLYGNGPDQLVPFFRALGEMGIRTER
jgi:hypothetical protein